MKSRILVFYAVLLFVGFVFTPLYAKVRPWELDKEHTNFYFTVSHIYAKVQGRFTDFDGEVVFDPDHLKDSRFSFAIKTKSIDTGISKRDKHVLSEDFLDASEYPLITFASSSIAKAGENLYDVSGMLTIKGTATEVIVPLTYEGMRDHPFVSGMEVVGFNGRLTVDRLVYKVGDGKYVKMGAVGKDVDILVTIEAMRKK
jgi:polyisoprenoid-binding protein YceI